MSYIGILIAALMIAAMAFFGWRGYFQSPAEVSKNTQAGLREEEINVSSYQDLLSSVKTQLNASTQSEIDRAKELGNLK
jgi:hypothetical protein